MKLKKQITAATDQMWERAGLLGDLIDSLPPELADKAILKNFNLEGLKIILPYDLEALRAARHQLGRGWKFEMTWGQVDPIYTYQCYGYKNDKFPGLAVDLTMRLNSDSCKVVQVGEVNTPVYATVCQ